MTPRDRIRLVNSSAERDGDWVLYWMIAARRPTWNFALQRAIERATHLDKPVLVLEALRVDHPWASDRLHRFVLDGMADNAAAFAARLTYLPYVEPMVGAGRGLLEALARRACLVVTDDSPTLFLPRMIEAAGRTLDVRLEAVDTHTIVPMRSTSRAFTTAASFRRHLQGALPGHLSQLPDPDPLERLRPAPCAPIPAEVLDRWPSASPDLRLSGLPIDHTVSPAPLAGGNRAATEALARFLDHGLDAYGTGRNHPDDSSSSGLSPYLHYGHLSAHEVLASVLSRESWAPDLLGPRPTGSRTGWWGLGAGAESYLDQLLTWRELAYNGALNLPGYDDLTGNPAWARRTLDEHRADVRAITYTDDELVSASTHDPVWNAAQRELVQTGVMHNYLRMLWGKKVLEWSDTPEQAFSRLVHLNNRYALDGRDPNSYAGIAWVFGRYDRAWGPERPIYGKVRYMTSESTRRKLRMRRYLERWSS